MAKKVKFDIYVNLDSSVRNNTSALESASKYLANVAASYEPSLDFLFRRDGNPDFIYRNVDPKIAREVADNLNTVPSLSAKFRES